MSQKADYISFSFIKIACHLHTIVHVNCFTRYQRFRKNETHHESQERLRNQSSRVWTNKSKVFARSAVDWWRARVTRSMLIWLNVTHHRSRRISLFATRTASDNISSKPVIHQFRMRMDMEWRIDLSSGEAYKSHLENIFWTGHEPMANNSLRANCVRVDCGCGGI